MAIKYVVNEEKQTVVAILNDCCFDTVKKIDKTFISKSNSFYSSFGFNDDRYRMNNTYKAVAKCSHGDVFDVNTGKKIAKKKVLAKYYKAMDKRMNLFYNDMQEIADDALGYIAKHCPKE